MTNRLPSFRISVHLACLLAVLSLIGPFDRARGATESARTPGRISVVPGGVALSSPGDLPGSAFEPAHERGGSAAATDEQAQAEWLIAPIPSHSPSAGWTLAMPVCRLYRPDGVAADAPSWVTGVAGFYSENESWGAGAFHKMNLANDRWRGVASALYAELRYNYYGINGSQSDQQPSLPLRQDCAVGLAEVLRRVGSDLYAGLRIADLNTKISVASWPAAIPPGLIPQDLGVNLTLLTFAPRVVYDTRNREYCPTAGDLVESQVQFSSKDLGSDADYTYAEFSWNHYLALGPKGVLAVRVAGKYASEGAPFFVYPAFGQGGDLRGYTPGTYRDLLLLATQAEYRYRIRKNIGFVVFAGVGGVASSVSEMSRALPDAGVGLRYVLAEENNVNLRVDFAWGRGDRQFYVGLGEAF